MDTPIKIKILDKEYTIRQTLSAFMIFEEMTGKNSFQVSDSITDITKLFYCYLRGANRESFTFSFDEFLILLDDNPEIFEDFSTYLVSLKGEKKGSNVTPPKKKRR